MKGSLKIGVVAGAFDVIHPGYIDMLELAKKNCDYLIVLLHIDPSTEHPEKPKPVLDANDRRKILLALRYVDKVIFYASEAGLLYHLELIKPDVRILGDDYKTKPITGPDICPIVWHERKSGWSATMLKQAYAESLKVKP